MVLAWTGVMRWKPMLEMASSIQFDSGGVSPSHALADDLSVVFCSVAIFSGAIPDDIWVCDRKVSETILCASINFWQT
jgi:hypothetical protein